LNPSFIHSLSDIRLSNVQFEFWLGIRRANGSVLFLCHQTQTRMETVQDTARGWSPRVSREALHGCSEAAQRQTVHSPSMYCFAFMLVFSWTRLGPFPVNPVEQRSIWTKWKTTGPIPVHYFFVFYNGWIVIGCVRFFKVGYRPTWGCAVHHCIRVQH
jgi:hypothetical protein